MDRQQKRVCGAKCSLHKVMTSVSLNMAFCQDFYKCLNWYVDLQLNKIVFSTVLNINPVVKTSKAFLILREIKLYNQKPNRTFVTLIESFIKTNMRNQWLNFLCPDGWIFFDYRWITLCNIFWYDPKFRFLSVIPDRLI